MQFFDLMKTAQQKFLRPATFLLLVAAAMYPFVVSPTYKQVVLFIFLGAVLRVVFDAELTINKRLAGIESNLSSPHPPSWPNYMAAQEKIMSRITEILEQGKELHIEIIGVSARFSWRMIEDHFPSLLAKYKKNNIIVDVAVTSKMTLEKWSLRKWIKDLDRTISGLESFAHDHNAEVVSGRLRVRHFNYDNIPHWHGVMLNKEVLFMGRTEWIYRADDEPDLRVGQCPYRLFELTDRYGGQARITMFANWIERLRRRHDELQGHYKGYAHTEPGATPDGGSKPPPQVN